MHAHVCIHLTVTLQCRFSGEQKKREEFYRERGEVDPSKLHVTVIHIHMYGMCSGKLMEITK